MNYTVENFHSEMGRQIDEMADAIKSICRLQVDLWKQIPALSLEADGREDQGFDNDKKIEYEYRITRISGSLLREGLFVNIDDGEIVYMIHPSARKQSAGVIEILSAVYTTSPVFVAQRRIDYLKEVIQTYPNFNFWMGGSKVDIEDWRHERRLKFNLPKPIL